TLRLAAARFVRGFVGDVLYAVKCNPEPAVLRALWQGGVRHFDCASPGEIRLVRELFPTAHIHYMHPIKAPAAIREGYAQHRVRDFSLDSLEELEKIVEVTGGARDLGLHIRLALPKGDALYDLSGKFGAAPDDAAELLRRGRDAASRLGICFHVGSQCMDPAAYEKAMALAGEVIAAAGVRVDGVDVGGGFPVSYPDITPPPLGRYFAAIERGFRALGLPREAALWCEPGRALAAPGASLVVKVEARRGQVLHINDGIYGTLSDAGVPRWRFPVRPIRPPGGAVAPFSFYGPTCDSADFMSGPFMLPDDIAAGEWIEIGQLGAYGPCLRTGFNGFDRIKVTEVADRPLLETPGHADRPFARRAA
ncbi:MAG TPA: type III PLP-dependent enzyme, partial [Stellaceae bacterium]|nr:type III PLP-dependent enzyme [Stellaceae bacterium]